MIIRAKAPLRLGIAGGGTDVSPYSDIYGGCVLNVTINMYTYCTIEPTDDGKIVIESRDRNEYFESISKNYLELDDKVILHKGVYNRLVKDFHLNNLSFKMTTYADAPAGCGLGTSSTMVVCIIKAFMEWLNLPLGEYDIANLAYSIEREDLKLSGGKQDQYAATFGGFNFMEFYKNNVVIINPIRVKQWIKNEIESELILYYTGTSRESAKIIDDQIKNTNNENKKSIQAMHELKETAIEMKNALLKAEFDEIANLLNKGWLSKKNLANSVTNPEIDKVYEFVINNGGKAAKISGAGGGGFMMILCDPKERYTLVQKLKKFKGNVLIPSICDDGCKSWIIYDK